MVNSFLQDQEGLHLHLDKSSNQAMEYVNSVNLHLLL